MNKIGEILKKYLINFFNKRNYFVYKTNYIQGEISVKDRIFFKSSNLKFCL